MLSSQASMELHRGIEQLPAFNKAVITIGTFDGVHLGHRKIIKNVIDEAEKIGGESVLITFDPHPRKIIHPKSRLELINTLEEKIQLLSATGIAHVVVVPFTQVFAALSADEYIEDFLVSRFHPHTIIIGYDHHFGKNRKGNYKLLEDRADRYGYQLLEISKLAIDEIDISSTKIRKAIISGDVDTANALLGYDFFFRGVVVDGEKLGRELGYPTANLEYIDDDKIHIGEGVYAVYVTHKEANYKGMLSVGYRSTVAGSEKSVEVNLFDFDADLYGENLTITVKKFLRPQEKFNSLEELIKQLSEDKRNSLTIL